LGRQYSKINEGQNEERSDYCSSKHCSKVVTSMERSLKLKCSNCGQWNSVSVNKIFLEQPSPEPKVKVMIPMHQPLEVTKCEKCGKVIAEPKELIRIAV